MMEVRLTPRNHEEMTSADDPHDPNWDKCMESNTTINTWIEEKTGDCGGTYHTWLKDQGLEANTDNGWWSLAACMEANLDAFARHQGELDELTT